MLISSFQLAAVVVAVALLAMTVDHNDQMMLKKMMLVEKDQYVDQVSGVRVWYL